MRVLGGFSLFLLQLLKRNVNDALNGPGLLERANRKLHDLHEHRRQFGHLLSRRHRFAQEVAERTDKLDALLLHLLLVKLHKAVSRDLNAKVPQRIGGQQFKRLGDHLLIFGRELISRRIAKDGLGLELGTDDLRLEPDQVRSKQRHGLLHGPQPKPGILALDLLRGGRLARRRLAANDVRDTRNLVNLALDLLLSLIALDQGRRDGVDGQKVNRALQSALFAKRRPLVRGYKGIVISLSQKPL